LDTFNLYLSPSINKKNGAVVMKLKLIFISFLLIPFILISYVYAERGLKLKRIENLSHKSGKIGDYKALIIGINDYKDR